MKIRDNLVWFAKTAVIPKATDIQVHWFTEFHTYSLGLVKDAIHDEYLARSMAAECRASQELPELWSELCRSISA